MIINDKRTEQRELLWKELLPGVVYVDRTGCYVICTDEESVVLLQSGTLYDEECYGKDDIFIPVKATLEVE